MMLLGCIADDFTGASDLANTLAKGGMSTVQFIGVPDGHGAMACDAGVVALKSRSCPPAEAIAQSLAALEWLKAQGCRQFLFKYCSTFDSTPEGNIGPVAEALLAALDAPYAVVCPAFPAAGRTLFMGHLFVHDRLLHESGMENHPLNPMIDSDLRRWLQMQAKGPVGFISHERVREGSGRIADMVDIEAAAGRRLVVVDAIEDDDLLAIGTAISGHKLITGGSGIALGLPENFRKAGLLSRSASPYTPTKGPGAVLSGSCSGASQGQVSHYLKTHPGFQIDIERLMTGPAATEEALAFARTQRARSPLFYSTTDPAAVSAAQSRFGGRELAQKIEHFFRALAEGLIQDGVTRLVVGGGETSGAVVSGLNADALVIGPEIDPGVPALMAVGERPVRLALKSGNFGTLDFYEKALNALGEF